MNAAQILQHHTAKAIAAGAQPIVGIPAKYNKIRFTSASGSTAGLVIESSRLARMNIQEVSRLFPWPEARFMTRFETSPDLEGWDAAFNYQFPV